MVVVTYYHEDKEDEMFGPRFRARVVGAFVLLLAVSVSGSPGFQPALAKTSVRVLPSEDGLELAHDEGIASSKTILPLYRTGGIRYFSAGVGLEERAADYPPFPLKIVFVVGGKPYLAQVDVHIVAPSGPLKLAIPRDRVTGPWLFVDLPDGTYEISAMWNGRTEINKAVNVSNGMTRVIYFRWPERPAH